ncbi:MAG: hypothetical protein IT384_29605 [Deltaproteobacteria bacterium]|nr:hypothetical protein [Deltaproteobacteria bacterium]
MKHVAISLISILALSPGVSRAQEGRFYLSTDRVFAPGQPVTVKVEANGVDALDLRLYRIADPRAYFDAQADLHRPRSAHEAPRFGAFSLLSRGFRRGLSGLLAETRQRFGREGRGAIKGAVPELHATATAGGAGTTPEVVLPPLKAHALLEAWRHPLSGEGWVYDTLTLPVFEPGAYLLEATSGKEVTSTVVLVTDVALVTKQSQSQLLVWAVDPASGEPRSGVELSVLERGAVLKSGTSGADGLARFDFGLHESTVIYAQHGKSFTLLDPRFYPANLPEPRVYLYTERPVYRPGQEVFFKGFARQLENEAYSVLAPQERGVSIEVRDPKGEIWNRLEATLSDRGSFDGRFELPEAPALGTWQLVALIDGKPYAGQFKVMAFVKPEVRLEVRLNQKAVRSGSALGGDVVGSYFFGAPYPDAEVKITVTRTRFYVPWYVDADYRWYYSDAEYKNTAREVISEDTCKLDARGECPFEVITKPDSEDYSYVVEATALDPTGKTISGTTQATVTTGAFRLSFEPAPLVVRPGEKQKVAIHAEDYAGRPVQTAVEILVKAQRLAADGVLENVELVRRALTTDAEGRAELEIDPSRGGYYTLTASAKDDGGAQITAESFLFASSGKGDLPFSPSELEIVTDQRSYFAGQSALVLILAPSPEAKVLFSVEGGEIYRAEVLTAQRFATLVKVDIGERQTPNFFVSAVAVTGGQVYTRQRSVIVPPREKILRVEVAPDRPEAKPGEQVGFTVHVHDWAGKPVTGAEIAMGVVDEAIYAISPEIAVPLESFFHPRKRNDVRTSESVSFRFFGSSQPISGERAEWREVDAALRFGALKPQLDDPRRIFKDTAGWFPSLITDGEGKARTTVQLPDNLTAWRATARVITPAAAVGMSTGTVRVKKPLMVRLALPPRLVEGDRGQGALVVQNLSGREASVDLSLSSVPLAEGDATPPTVSVRATGEQPIPGTLRVPDGQTVRVPFEYTAGGSGRVRFSVAAKDQELADALESSVDVAEWARVVRVSAHARTRADAPRATLELALPPGAKPEEARLELEVVPSVLAAIRASLPYLAGYPYGCTEQTLSRFLPLLAAKSALTSVSLDLGGLEPELPKMIATGVARLGQLQHEDGGWGWWERDASDVWMTAWALEGLAEAKVLGAKVTPEAITRGARALEQLLGEPQPPAVRAFALYALARAEHPLTAMIEQLGTEIAALDPVGLAHLALTAKLSAKPALVEAASQRLSALAARPDEQTTEALALMLLALRETGADARLLEAQTAALLSRFEDQRFGTTRETALAVRVLVKHLEAASQAPATLIVRANGAEILKRGFDARRADPVERLAPRAAITAGQVSLEIEQSGPGAFALAAAVLAPVRSKIIDAHGGDTLGLSRTLLALSGASGAYRVAGPLKRLRSGEPVLVRLVIEASEAIDHLIVEDPRAAGLSAIESDSGLQIEGVELRGEGVRREHRDEATVFFVTRVPKGRTELSYLARAGLSGSYRVLPARAESMYLPNRHHAQSASRVIDIEAK